MAHPGHELRIIEFMSQTRPLVAVLTDGSGSTGQSRLTHTSALLEQIGATPATVFGRLTDREAYAAMMSGDWAAFLQVALDLSAAFRAHQITAVAVDAAEGYNPVHDICRILAESAAGLLRANAPALFEFDLLGHPDGRGDGIRLQLDDAAFARKIAAVKQYDALAAEAQAAFDAYGVESFRTEFIRYAPATNLAPASEIPYYERVGDERVREGRYSQTLRYSAHVRPLMSVLLSLCPAGVHASPVDPIH
jgi:hypothetical protein